MNFVKPGKIQFVADEQTQLRKQIDEAIRKDAASFAAVDKVYLMGSVIRSELGFYQAPFVHGRSAKLGSDIDILIEINPKRETDIPTEWKFINPEASSHCAIYHLSGIPLKNGMGDWPSLYSNIEFVQHLIDAYVFFPSRGYHAEKDAFLKKFGAKLVYDRSSDGIYYRDESLKSIAESLEKHYDLGRLSVEKFNVTTENALFKVFTDQQCYILKLFKVAGNYSGQRVAEHTQYEEKLVICLKHRGIATADVIPAKLVADVNIEGFPALLFERIEGAIQQKPEYELQKIAAALAEIHQVQMQSTLPLSEAFTFDDSCMIWLPAFNDYLQNISSYSASLADAFNKLAPVVEQWHSGENRTVLFEHSVLLHNHGDVKPKNVILSNQNEPCFFDFNNAFYGPRMADIIDGAFEFSLAEKYIELADFSRFYDFIKYYAQMSVLTSEEEADISRWIELIGIIKFTKEVRVFLQKPDKKLRMKRALVIADFVLEKSLSV